MVWIKLETEDHVQTNNRQPHKTISQTWIVVIWIYEFRLSRHKSIASAPNNQIDYCTENELGNTYSNAKCVV